MLENLEPKDVFKYFEKICAIPHSSYHTDKIADYVVSFAKAHNFEYSRDKHNNVVIKKPAQNSNSDNTVIIQGHLDMVCAKDDSVEIDFENEGIRLNFDSEYVFAKGTTLGGDDGIAVAMALAILDSKTISHPNLECVFTTDEEVGMTGATALDMSNLKGTYMLNIDSEDEGEFTVSCAGGETLVVEMKKENSTKAYSHTVKLSVNGLLGGHSGIEINKGRANAVILMGKLLGKLNDVQLVDIEGGQKDNAIPFECYATINTNDVKELLEVVEACKEEFKNQYPNEELINITAQEVEVQQGFESSVFQFISAVTNGVRAMSKDIENLVQTSSNLGIIRTESDKVLITFSLRSSVAKEKKDLHAEIEKLAQKCGAMVSSFGEYPAWEFKKNSKLQELCQSVYKEQYNEDAKIVAIHAGLECGIFTSRIPNLDCISFGPNLKDIHTSKERMEIKSVERVYKFVLTLISRL